MKLDYVAITDHIKNFSIEKKLLGKYFEDKVSDKTTIILVWHKQIDKEFLTNHPSIRAVVRYGVGYDNIDIDYCKKKNILVANTPDYGIEEVADSALAMILYLTRKIGALEQLAKRDTNYWLGKPLNLNMRRLNKLSLGIIGFGRIGSSICSRFSGFSRNISFYDPYIPNGYEKVHKIHRHINLSDLLKNSDIVTINTPLNDETKGMVNREFLNQMKKGSYLINLSRGPIVEKKDLILEKLLSNHLEGYGTDVWTNEPPSNKDRLNVVWKENQNNLKGRIIVNPHTAYYSKESLIESRTKACSTCLDIINHHHLRNKIV